MAREYAPDEPVAKKQREFAPDATTPVATKQEPSFGEQLYGGAYGLGSSILGTPGDIESMVTLPAKDPKLRGYETIFPTSENVKTGFQQLGLPAPAPGTEASVRLGELVPAIAGGAQLVKTLGGYGIGKIGDLTSTLLGRRTAAQEQQVSKAAREAEATGGKALSATEAEQQRLLREQQAQVLAAQEAQKARQAMATTAGAKSEAKGGRSLKELAGVRTLPELGTYKPIPETPQKVGEFIRTQAENFLNSIKSQRSKAADVNFTKAKINATQEEARGRFVDTKPLLAEMDALIAKGGTTDYLNSIKRLRDDIEATKGFEGLEVIRRRLGDAAFGVPEEGYKAIGQKFSQKMYDDLAGQMRDFDKNFAKYLDDYRRLSDPIRVYGTKVGKSITQTEDAAGRYIAKPPEKVAEEIFSTPQNFDRFLEAVGGNSEIATAAARRFFAGKLETAKTPEAVEKLARDYRELLLRPEMLGVRQDIERYLKSIVQAGRRTTAAGKIVEESALAQKAVADQAKVFEKQVSDKLKGIAEGRKLFSDSVEALASAKPNAAIKTFEETVLPKIRAAEQKAGTQLLSEQQLQGLRQQVQELEKISDKTTRARVITGILGTYLLGEAGVSKIRQMSGMPSGE